MQLLFPLLRNQWLYLSHFDRGGAWLQMADIFLFFWYRMGLLLYTFETKPKSMIIVNVHMYFQSKKGWCCGFFEGAVGQAELWLYIAQELGGFSFNIILIFLGWLNGSTVFLMFFAVLVLVRFAEEFCYESLKTVLMLKHCDGLHFWIAVWC
jgi:hypothetical protein